MAKRKSDKQTVLPTIRANQAIPLLRRQVERMADLKSLHHDDPKIDAWESTTQSILDSFYGLPNGELHPNTAEFKYAKSAGEWYVDMSDEAIQANYALALAKRKALLESYVEQIEDLAPSLGPAPESRIAKAQEGVSIFIGHGQTQLWRELKDFLSDELKLDWEEFNREPVAGLTTKERLQAMLGSARFAFLLMTGEDERSDGTKHARGNVVHEIGLFQGRLGFEKAIVLLEEGCTEFSNIVGLTQIRFPKGQIKAVFEDVRRVLRREGVLPS